MRLVLPLPPSTNHIYLRTGSGMQALKPNVRAFRDEVEARVLEQLCGQGDFPPRPYRMTVRLVHGDKRRHDIDNALKSLCDSLALALGFDDNDIHELHVSKRYERGRSECVVEIEAMEGEVR